MTNYRTIDLFAGIGGFRLGFENTGHPHVYPLTEEEGGNRSLFDRRTN